jgi:hypothetical protein
MLGDGAVIRRPANARKPTGCAAKENTGRRRLEGEKSPSLLDFLWSSTGAGRTLFGCENFTFHQFPSRASALFFS